MKTGIILLARLGSTRLPGKVLLSLCGRPVLEHIILRLRRVRRSEKIIVATTQNGMDDIIEQVCRKLGVSCFRGSEDNVLDRCVQTSETFDLDVIVRLGADNPFVDREIIDDMLHIFQTAWNNGKRPDYMSNSMDRSFPLGLDCEIFHRDTFRRLAEETKCLPLEERRLNENNVSPFIHQNPERFRIISFKKDFDYSHLRWTLDTPEDFDLITRVYDALYPVKPDFLMEDILDLLSKFPQWSEINAQVKPVTGYWTGIEQAKLHRRFGNHPEKAPVLTS